MPGLRVDYAVVHPDLRAVLENLCWISETPQREQECQLCRGDLSRHLIREDASFDLLLSIDIG
jgi:hypothetical protein